MSEVLKLDLDSRVVVGASQISREISGEAYILQLDNGVYFSLDGVGALVWEMVQEPRSVREIRARILSEYDVDEQRCEQDLIELLHDLHARKLVDVRNEPPG